MNFVQSSAVVPVNLQVTRYRTWREEGLVEVWGYVGDYEVCVHLTLAQARARGLVPSKRRDATRRTRAEES